MSRRNVSSFAYSGRLVARSTLLLKAFQTYSPHSMHFLKAARTRVKHVGLPVIGGNRFGARVLSFSTFNIIISEQSVTITLIAFLVPLDYDVIMH